MLSCGNSISVSGFPRYRASRFAMRVFGFRLSQKFSKMFGLSDFRRRARRGDEGVLRV